jgi:two-component system, response regulator
MSPAADVLVVNDRILDSQATLVALEFVAPRARVLHLESGQQALEYLFATGEYHGRRVEQPRLVLLSLELERVSGLCVLDFMRGHPSTQTIPVVLLSLESDVRKHRRHDRFDADAYVVQPCDFQRYCAVLQGCIRHWLPWALRPGTGELAALSVPGFRTHAPAYSQPLPLTESLAPHRRLRSADLRSP